MGDAAGWNDDAAGFGGGVVSAPDRSLDQRLEALQRANAIRAKRARVKADIAQGVVGWLDVLASPDPDLASMRVMDVLLAVPRVGRGKAESALARCKVSPAKTIGGLTVRQRAELSSTWLHAQDRPRERARESVAEQLRRTRAQLSAAQAELDAYRSMVARAVERSEQRRVAA